MGGRGDKTGPQKSHSSNRASLVPGPAVKELVDT